MVICLFCLNILCNLFQFNEMKSILSFPSFVYNNCYELQLKCHHTLKKVLLKQNDTGRIKVGTATFKE